MPSTWDIKTTRSSLGSSDVYDHILFIHAVLGCNTTSRLHGPGKRVALTYMRNPVFCEEAKVFMNHDIPKDSIITAGEIAVVS